MTHPAREFTVTLDGVEYEVIAEGKKIRINGRPFAVEAQPDVRVLVDGIAYEVVLRGDHVDFGGTLHDIEVTGLSVSARPSVQRSEPLLSAQVDAGDGAIVAIMPGKVTRITVEVGQEVQEGQAVCVLEAMKMENELRADRAGIVSAINVNPGDDVEKGQVLVDFT